MLLHHSLLSLLKHALSLDYEGTKFANGASQLVSKGRNEGCGMKIPFLVSERWTDRQIVKTALIFMGIAGT